MFSLPPELRKEAIEGEEPEDEEPDAAAHSIDENLVISESDISCGSLPDEVTVSNPLHDAPSLEEGHSPLIPNTTFFVS